MTTALPEILETLILGPDDRLVIVLPTGTSQTELDHYRQIIDKQGFEGFAGRVLLVANAEQLAVLRGVGLVHAVSDLHPSAKPMIEQMSKKIMAARSRRESKRGRLSVTGPADASP